MKQAFINWAVPFFCGAVMVFLGGVLVKVKALSEGVKCLLRAEIIRQYEKWAERGYCPIYAKEALTMAYKAYHALGGNDVATELYNKAMDLKSDKGDDDNENKLESKI